MQLGIAFRLSGLNRERKWRKFQSLIGPTSETTILDVGFSDKEYSPIDNYLEKRYPYPAKITALGIDEPCEFPRRYPEVKAVRYDGRQFPFADKEFDVCWSNAVIEHVGTREDQTEFIREIARVSSRAFVTTPNRHFPVEVHTRTPLLHMLPKRMFDSYLIRVGKKWAAGKYMNLLALCDIRRLLEEAGISDYKIVRNRLFGFTMDYIIVFGDSDRVTARQEAP